ncbi:MAG TPA: 4-hydroxy-tetrahydrodipicolinate reductase [Cyclobacteriaceae bacterium]|nr:4-hydroxy-tetrahydrodipicolinate reductase [Cyclobacteriaceae bacterium]HRF34184.1 4-hydroxy-tetrahydrodipicolinate reductase [Cyclobacteriaceae bacterium]
MRILLIGYGKMGKTIEGIATQRGNEIAGRIDTGDSLENFNEAVDVAIEFTQPEAVVKNLKTCFDKGIPVVCGTTGWGSRQAETEAYCKSKNGTLLASSNFSLGVNIFFKLNEYLARIMQRYEQYEVSIDETHHTQKKDAPSGTAISLAQGVLKNIDRKTEWTLGASDKPHTLSIQSFRVDPAPGTHVVKYQSAIDDIEITHTAHTRQGFALGAVLVAEWLADKKGIFTMDDFLKL